LMRDSRADEGFADFSSSAVLECKRL
jgi:hypothetical protein